MSEEKSRSPAFFDNCPESSAPLNCIEGERRRVSCHTFLFPINAPITADLPSGLVLRHRKPTNWLDFFEALALANSQLLRQHSKRF
jgi:hypothetical protein